ncbi:LuxR C-terminal-related transcriptional regulator [Nocardioides koreensis]|uniref:LuxR C-terminal-related transcriptional regulator n=1 Tax=Nocardioides koreensis TaxID=433651 RepID=UPI0031E10AFD
MAGTDPAETSHTAARYGVPQVPALHVHRPRLVALLDRSPSAPLVLVSGPAGSGKTSLVAEWVHEGAPGEPVGWVTFEDDDTRLWQALLDCLARMGLEPPRAMARPQPELLLGRTRLRTLAAAITGSERRWTLVLDGYELRSAELAAEVAYLLDHTLGRLRLVFAARVDPMLPLYRYRLDDTLVEVRASDLALTDAEAAELLRRCGAALGPDAVHDLTARLSGWAAGLRFAARALARYEHPERSVASVVAQDSNINEFLLAEVLRAQEPEARRLLLATCVPDIVWPELAEVLAGPRAGHGLADLARANMFLEPVPDRPGCHRYFPFFRDLLRAQLAYEDPERAATLHRRAAAWLREHGMPVRSVAQLAAGGLWVDAARQLVGDLLVVRLVLGPDERLVEIARRIPVDASDPHACVVRAALAVAAYDPETCAHELARARSALASVPSEATDGGALVLSLTLIDLARACTSDEIETADALVDETRAQLDTTRNPAATLAGAELEALVEVAAAIIALRRGALGRARAALSRIDERAGLPIRFAAAVVGYRALVDALDGQLTQAHREATRAVALADDAHLPPESRNAAAAVALALVALERDDATAARQHLASARTCRSLLVDPVCRTVTSGVIAHLEAASGPDEPVTARLESISTRALGHDPWLAGWLRRQAAELSVAHGRADQALRALDAIEPEDGLGGAVVAAAAHAEQGQEAALAESLDLARTTARPLPVEVTRLLVEGVRESRSKSPRHATPLLERALRLAAREQVRRPFREAAPSVRLLLADNPQLLSRHRWLAGPSAASGIRISPEPTRTAARRTPVVPSARATGTRRREDPTDLSELVVEPLTAKEQEVLGHLEELLTTEEMAEKMFVSVNTIRTHVRSILRKLGVNRRNSAVRRARELGLFDR